MQRQLGAQPADRGTGRKTWTQLAEARGVILGLCPECGMATVVTLAYLPKARAPDADSRAIY